MDRPDDSQTPPAPNASQTPTQEDEEMQPSENKQRRSQENNEDDWDFNGNSGMKHEQEGKAEQREEEKEIKREKFEHWSSQYFDKHVFKSEF